LVTTTPSGPPRPARISQRVGIWGAPGTGKSTFLASLFVAVIRGQQQLQIYGANQDSTRYLVQNTSTLADQLRFPEATQASQALSWIINMKTQVPAPRKFGRSTTEWAPLQFNLDLHDVPGGLADAVPQATQARAGLFDDDEDAVPGVGPGNAPGAESEDEAFVEHLAGSNGILLLFDPIREWTSGDAFRYFYGPLLKIAERRLGARPGVDPRLPHHVAVCVTKFDHPNVYRWAKRFGYCSSAPDDPHLFPRVHDADAERFFAELCRQSDLGNADLVSGALRQYFRPERIKFFITSAIGFYLDRQAARFTDQDYQNTVPVPPDQRTRPVGDGRPELILRGPIHPINVVEPLVWLGRSLAADGGR
jgi:hypothetical protein